MRSGALLGFATFVLAASFGAAPALAHHSSAMFDADREITLAGTVQEFQYTNPHSWLQVMVSDKDGKQTLWGFEAEGPSTLLRQGIKISTFKPGDKVTMIANPMRDGRPAGRWLSVTTAAGKTYVLRAPTVPRTAD